MLRSTVVLVACLVTLRAGEARAQDALDWGLELAGGTAGAVVLGGVGLGAGLLVGVLDSDPADLWTDVAIWTVLGGALGAGLGGWLGVTSIARWRDALGDGDKAMYGAVAGFLAGLVMVAVPIGLGVAQENERMIALGAWLAIPAVLAPGLGATIGFNTGVKELVLAPAPVRTADGVAPGLALAGAF